MAQFSLQRSGRKHSSLGIGSGQILPCINKVIVSYLTIELSTGVLLRLDNNEGSSSDKQQIFAMAGDGSNDDVKIPAVLLFSEEGRILKNAIAAMEDVNQHLTVRLASKATGMSGTSSR